MKTMFLLILVATGNWCGEQSHFLSSAEFVVSDRDEAVRFLEETKDSIPRYQTAIFLTLKRGQIVSSEYLKSPEMTFVKGAIAPSRESLKHSEKICAGGLT